MKIILSVFCVLGAVFFVEGHDDILVMLGNQLDECGKDLKIDVTPFKAKGHPDLAKLSEEQYKCLPKCIMEKFGLIDANGTYLPEKLKEHVTDMPENIQTAIDTCIKDNTQEDLCARYSSVQKCMMEKLMH